MMQGKRRDGLVVAALMTLLQCCVFSPIPEPPTLDPPKLSLVEITLDIRSNGVIVEIEGNAGSAEPGAVLWVFELSSTLETVQTNVAADGSFQTSIESNIFNELRLQLREGERRSEPVDILVGENGELLDPPRAACLVVDPPRELDFGSFPASNQIISESISLRNDCGEVMLIDHLFRASSPVFSVETATPITLPANDGSAIDLTFTPQEVGTAEDILFLEITSSFTERRPISLFGTGR